MPHFEYINFISFHRIFEGDESIENGILTLNKFVKNNYANLAKSMDGNEN